MEDDVAGGNYDPFWVGFPLVDIHKSITPDILHQLYQGILKHLIEWVQQVVGAEELDRRMSSLPPACGVRHFKHGISLLTQVSGTERKHIARILLSCLVGKIEPCGIVACWSLLHFIQLAQYPSHNEETLSYMQQELDIWHTNRSFFNLQNIRDDFNIPKYHSLLHYIESIRWLGTTDNYNTEAFECLHIDFAKQGWHASNKRDHFPQMVKWLSRQEKVASYDFYRSWMDKFCADEGGDDNKGGNTEQEQEINIKSHQAWRRSIANCAQFKFRLAKSPAELSKSISRILVTHSAPGFVAQLKLFLASLLPPNQAVNKLTALESSLPFSSLDVWHQLKFRPFNLSDNDSNSVQEVIKAILISKHSSIPRFDTVLVLDSDEAESTAVQGRTQIIF
ncbi:hypothetical protein GYMLUDRAFT_182852 [Collybiopsis luxurians FD-317 M1]|uniref:Uncharacterized protein n=1 Tax=Collybiopsis luxurians FD-317 M1 TaxID=944289 RepID=A0A0D0BY90_9AGAR|nr:hypothetical protein GYMLUDRAFT_182852 [Collybiopsis luxurians FD-317 M1]